MELKSAYGQRDMNGGLRPAVFINKGASENYPKFREVDMGTFRKNRIAAALLCAVFLTGCSEAAPEKEPEKQDARTEDDKAKTPEEKDIELEDTEEDTETSYMKWRDGDVFGICLLGGGYADLAALKDAAGKETGTALSMAFTKWKDLSSVTTLAADTGGELYYVLFPRWKNESFTFSERTVVDETGINTANQGLTEQFSELAQVSADGNPLIVKCGVSDLYGDLQIDAKHEAEGTSEEAAFIPFESPRDGQTIGEAGETGVHITLLVPPDASQMSDVLYTAVGWGGSAGSTLDSYIAAVSMLQWTRENYISRYDGDEISGLFEHWYGGQDRDTKANYKENMPSILEAGESILSGDPDAAGALSDSGMTEQAEELKNYSGIEDTWSCWKGLMNTELGLGL